MSVAFAAIVESQRSYPILFDSMPSCPIWLAASEQSVYVSMYRHACDLNAIFRNNNSNTLSLSLPQLQVGRRRRRNSAASIA